MIAPLAIPAFVALLFKVVLLGYCVRSARRSAAARVLLVLLILVALQNLIEFLGMNGFTGAVTPFVTCLGFAYIALLAAVLASILHMSICLSLDSRSKTFWPLLLYIPCGVLVYLLLATDQLVLGFQPFKNTILRVPGPWYGFFENYLILYTLAALGLLVYGARESRPTSLGRTRNRLWLFALLPTGLLLTYLIVANHYRVAKLTSTIYLPVTLTFFLAIATYATHKHRLVDIAYFIPWSKVRKRKKAFYRRVQTLIADKNGPRPITELLKSLANTLGCPVALIGGPSLLYADASNEPASTTNQPRLSEFPRDTLQGIDSIIVAHEISDSAPTLYALMRQYGVEAIAPFIARQSLFSHWILFGEPFSEQVYTSTDFRVLEPLLDKVSQRFTDNLHQLHIQLSDAREAVRAQQRRLAVLWDELSRLREAAARAEVDNRDLREERAALLRDALTGVAVPTEILSGAKSLDEYLRDTEKEILATALRHAGGSTAKAARLLGFPSERALLRLLLQHGLDSRGDA